MNNTQLYVGIMLKKHLTHFDDTRLILSVIELFDINEWEKVLSFRKFFKNDTLWQIHMGFGIPMSENIKGAVEYENAINKNTSTP
ncbi:hypothetical protein OAF16_01055 [Flavobacteriales bacterium]|nr:hypothetical protein [Flavobacteriales bacterium]